MSVPIGSYSPNDVAVLVNGTPISGFADGDMIAFAYDTDAATLKQGADGNAAVSVLRGQRMASLTIRLMQTSMANNYLSGLLFAQQNGTGVFAAITVLNTQGGELIQMARGVIGKEPDRNYSAEVGASEWKFVGQAIFQPAGFQV